MNQPKRAVALHERLIVHVAFLCCAFFLTTNLFAASDPPFPASSPKRSQKKAHPTTPIQNAASDQRGTENFPLIVKVLDLDGAEKHTEQNASEVKQAPHEDRSVEVAAIVATGVATVVVAIFTALLHRSTRNLWKEAVKAGGTAEATAGAAKKSADAALLSLRPWVSCDAELLSDLTYRENGDARISVRFSLKNHGHTPAMGVRVKHWFDLLGPGMEHPLAKRQKWVEFDKGLPISAWEHGVLLFPGQERHEDIGLMISRKEIEKSIADIQPSKHFIPTLALR